MNNNSPLDQGLPSNPKPKRVRKTKHNFKLSDIKKADVKNTGFTTKQQSIKFLNDVLDKQYTFFKTKDELINYVKIKRDKLNKYIDLSDYGKKKMMTKKGKDFLKNVQYIETKLYKYDERKPKKFHITAEIKRAITFT